MHDTVYPIAPILTHPTKLQRRQTIDTVRARQYSSRRTALQHLQAMFRPIRGKMKIPIDNEQEQMQMTGRKQKTGLRRTSSVCDSHRRKKNENSNQRQRRHHIRRRSDTVDIV